MLVKFVTQLPPTLVARYTVGTNPHTNVTVTRAPVVRSLLLQCFFVYPVNLDGGNKNFGRITEIDRITKIGRINHILLLLLATVT